MTANLSALVHRLAGADPADAPDADLLARFVAGRDPAAFAELVRRHGPAVLGVCRRVVGDHHLAEDAFQAVFVVLAAKAGCVRPPAALGGWLYGVAHRTALRARTMRDRRRRRERAAARPEAVSDHAPDDLAAVLDAEIARLPDAQRAAMVLCELGGRSRAEAAAELGVREGTLSSRLAAARKALAARLRSRGLALPAALAPAVLAAVPPGLAARATAAATTPHLVPAAVAALSQGVLRVMFLQQLRFAPLALVASAALAAGLLASPTPQPQPPPAAPPLRAAADPPKEAPKAMSSPNRLFVWRKGEIVALDPDGKNEKTVLAGAKGVHPSMFAVSPDGKRIAVVQPADDDPAPAERLARLYVRELGAGGAEVAEVGAGATAAWSPDGTELVYCAFSDALTPKDVKATTTVFTIATKAKAAVKLPDNHILSDWSRDGKQFLTMEVGTSPESPIAGLWVMNRDGSPHKKLTGDPGMAFGRFSPDDTRVLGVVIKELEPESPRERAEREKLGVARVRAYPVLTVFDVAAGKGTPVRDVPLNADVQGFCWSPDGRRVAYVWRERHPLGANPNTETQSHLTVCDADGANQRTILTEKGARASEMVLGGVEWR